MRSKNLKTFVYLLPHQIISVNGELEGVPGKNVTVQWFNPLTGGYSDKEEQHYKNSWISLHPPHDWSDDQLRIVIVEVQE